MEEKCVPLEEYNRLKSELEGLQREYQMTMKMNLNEINHAREIKSSYDQKEKELNRIIRKVEEQEQENVKLAEKLNQATSEGQQLRKENEKYKQNLGKV
jgi:uncharacterized coiled-coil DUF342 family protein